MQTFEFHSRTLITVNEERRLKCFLVSMLPTAWSGRLIRLKDLQRSAEGSPARICFFSGLFGLGSGSSCNMVGWQSEGRGYDPDLGLAV